MTLEHVPGKNVGDIKIYALSTCPWCKKTKGLLSGLGIDYYFIDVDLLEGKDREQAMAVVRKWNPSGSFPTIIINNDRCIVGFKEVELREALNL
jgi:glutaredoxin-like protein NrdH